MAFPLPSTFGTSSLTERIKETLLHTSRHPASVGRNYQISKLHNCSLMIHYILDVTGPKLQFSQTPFDFTKSFLLCFTVSFVIYPSVYLNYKDTIKVKSLSHTVFEKSQRTVCMLKYHLLRLLLPKHVSPDGNIVQFSSKQQTNIFLNSVNFLPHS